MPNDPADVTASPTVTSPASKSAKKTDPSITEAGRLTATAPGRCPVALTMLPSARHPEVYLAAEIHGVRFERIELLDVSHEGERRGGAMARLEVALFQRTMRMVGGWATNYMRRQRGGHHD